MASVSEILDLVFTIRAKDELGQYLDDEQVWQEGLEWTQPMMQRATTCVSMAKRYVDTMLNAKIDDALYNDLWAEATVVFILRRRGGEDFRTMAEMLKNKIDGVVNRRTSAYFITSRGGMWRSDWYDIFNRGVEDA
jgi:hypothetical protein